MRRDVAHTESQLDAAVDRVAARLTANPSATRAAMFAMLHGQAAGVRQGIRIVAPNGDAIAWWGEDLRTPGTTSYEFDATNLYIIRSKPQYRTRSSRPGTGRREHGTQASKSFGLRASGSGTSGIRFRASACLRGIFEEYL